MVRLQQQTEREHHKLSTSRQAVTIQCTRGVRRLSKARWYHSSLVPELIDISSVGATGGDLRGGQMPHTFVTVLEILSKLTSKWLGLGRIG